MLIECMSMGSTVGALFFLTNLCALLCTLFVLRVGLLP